MASQTILLPPDLVRDGAGDPGRQEAYHSSVLHSYVMMDTPREPVFDDLARIAADVCGTPIAAIVLVDTNRKFFKAEFGLGVREMPLGPCGAALLADDVMIVPDVTADPRFGRNPLAPADPDLRFYAGALLKSPEEVPIGALCVSDYQPRELNDQQVRTLMALARQAMALFELQRALAAQQNAQAAAAVTERDRIMMASLGERSPDFISMTGPDGEVVYVNEAARGMVGIDPDIVRASRLPDYVVKEDRPTILREVMPTAAASGCWEGELRLRHFETEAPIPVQYTLFPLRSTSGELVGYGNIARELTDCHRDEQRREALVHEMAHRMNNTLAIVRAIVTQTFRMADSIGEAKDAIESRLTALAQAQTILTTRDSLTRIEDIIKGALAPHRTRQRRISLKGPSCMLTGPQALGLTLALHELATNAAKYGALSAGEGRVSIVWSLSEDGEFHLEWIESEGPPVSPPGRPGFGSKLLERVVASYFEGEAHLRFEPAGLIFQLSGRISTATE